MAIKIYPYKQGSRSAKALADALGGRVLKREGSRYHYSERDLIINWGASYIPFPPSFNDAARVVLAGNKLSTFNLLAGVCEIPRYTADADVARSWDTPIVSRTVLNGHSGVGIHIAVRGTDPVAAPLYVEYIPKRDEYRVHVVNGCAVAVQRKARRVDHDTPNWQVRNHANGFNFIHMDVGDIPEELRTQSITAVEFLGLEFGAVDVIYNQHRNKYYVLEVNTAPGLEGRTIQAYANAFLGR